MKAAYRRLRWAFGNDSGSTLILFALVFVLLAGAAALAIDGGLAYAEKRRLQIAADSAALAAAAELPANPGLAVQRAVEFAALNGGGVESQDVIVEEGLADDDTVRVTARSAVAFMLAPVIGIPSADLRAGAVARVGSLRSSDGIVPWGLLLPPGGYQFGNTYTLKLDVGGAHAGNFNALALGGTGANTYTNNVVNGSADEYSVGQTITMEPGNMKGPTLDGLIRRIGNDPYTRWTDLVNADGALNGIDDDNPRIVLLPVITPPEPGRSTVTILSFALFYVEGSPAGWDGSQVTGAFVKDIVVGKLGPFSANPLNPKVISLVE